MGEAALEERISEEVVSLIGTARQTPPFSTRYPGFDFGVAYSVVARVRDLRMDRGEMNVGRKIGFTNRSIWGSHGISAPIWNYIFDRTLSYADRGQATIEVGVLPEPRIEPELVLHLASAPLPGMTPDELVRCVDWVAPGFELPPLTGSRC
jgi:2-oxo-3-hexenedioate decarboxylase